MLGESDMAGGFRPLTKLEEDLPIGSGLIESGHKHVLQARMKLPGAAWKIDNAEHMVRARAFQANKQWDPYWQKAA